MPDPRDKDTPQAHGVHGTQRDDSKMQEEPDEAEATDEEGWADLTETGGQAAS